MRGTQSNDNDMRKQRRLMMVESQLRTNRVTDPAVLDAFAAIPREVFVAEDFADLAYIDEDLMLGGGRFIVEPRVLARLIQALNLKRSDNVLDIGTGSGYGAAVLGRIAESVIRIDSDPEYAGFAQEKINKVGFDNVAVLTGNLAEGYPDNKPYQAIIIEGAVEYVPENILAQLAPDGRLVTVLRPPHTRQGRAVCYRAGEAKPETLFDANTPLLEAFREPAQFRFGT